MGDERYTLTMAEAAKLLGVHRDSLKRWADAGKVPCWRTPKGGHRRFRRSDLEALISNGDKEPA